MCDPLTLGITVAAIGSASAISQHQGAKQLANTQRKRQDMMVKLRTEKLKKDLLLNKQQQILKDEARRRDLEKVSKEAALLFATKKVAADQAGITGISVDHLLNEVMGEEAAMFEQSRRQAELGDLETFNTASLMGEQWRADVAGIRAPITEPTAAGLALNIAGAGVQGAQMYAMAGGFKDPEATTDASKKVDS